MKAALVICIVASVAIPLSVSAADKSLDSDEILYLKDAKTKEAHFEVFDLYVHEDGSLHNGSYKKTYDQIRHNFKLWRRWSGDPLVIVYLYPRLRSNNDLKRLREIAAFLDAEKVPWQFGIYTDRDPVPHELRSKGTKSQK